MCLSLLALKKKTFRIYIQIFSTDTHTQWPWHNRDQNNKINEICFRCKQQTHTHTRIHFYNL